MTDETEVSARLVRFLAEHPDSQNRRITGLARAGNGRSRDNWLFDLAPPSSEEDGPSESLILRTDPAGGLIDTDRATEFAVLQGLEKSSLPTPVVRWLDADGHALGRPSLIMQRLPGVCDYRVLRNDALPRDERLRLARRFCALLTEVHAVDWHSLGLDNVLPDPGPGAALAELEHWTSVLHKDQLEPWPELEYAIVVLTERAPTSSRTVLVHADYKPGNLLLKDNEVTALLDWELAHLGDPLEDLGWATQPLRVGEHTIEEVWEAKDLVACYEDSTGTSVDRAALAWWVCYSAFKTAVMQVSGLRAFVDGRAEEPYRPTRRVLATLLDAISEEKV